MAGEVHEGEPEEAKHIPSIEGDVGRPADGVDPDQLSLGAGCGDDDVELLLEIGVLLLRGSRVRRRLADNCQIFSVRWDNCQIGQL